MKIGRPVMDEKSRRGIVVKFRVTQDEFSKVKKMAVQRDASMSEMIRSFIFQDSDNENKSR
jgi:hypothetical protein